MHSYHDLIKQSKPDRILNSREENAVHAFLTAYSDRLQPLKHAVQSLLSQIDALHVFLDGFTAIPDFLDHDKIYLTRSQDFGNLGECGKYYWTDDLPGYHFICSDRLIYPADYVESMKSIIENHERKAVIGAGGYRFSGPFISFGKSAQHLPETGSIEEDVQVSVLNDNALAYHSSAFRNSRHFYYQSELSGLWFSMACIEQNVPLFCCSHPAGWLIDTLPEGKVIDTDVARYRDFLLKSLFSHDALPEDKSQTADINAFFDRVYVMNLDRRPDRWAKICRTAEKHNINITRFPAVDGYAEPHKSKWERYAASGLQRLPEGIDPLEDHRDKFKKYYHYVARIHYMENKLGRKAVQSPGALGYALSYISILKEAIQKDYRRILIFDDDIILHKNFNEDFTRHTCQLPDDWKLYLPGVMQHHWEPHITRYGDFLYSCHGSSVASHAVGIDRKAFLPLLFYAEKLDLPIDEGAIFHIQNVYHKQCFISFPNLAIQDMSGSDIGTSAMKKEDIENWMKRFRWNLNDYEF
jgi:GR25 family glycosyltransferase involved in LPS biosynthesis